MKISIMEMIVKLMISKFPPKILFSSAIFLVRLTLVLHTSNPVFLMMQSSSSVLMLGMLMIFPLGSPVFEGELTENHLQSHVYPPF